MPTSTPSGLKSRAEITGPIDAASPSNSFLEGGRPAQGWAFMARKRVLVADDLAPVLATVGTLLRPSFEIVDMVSDGRAALDAALKLEPDLVVLDISMPLMSGIEVAEQLQRLGSKTKVVFLTVHEDHDILKTCRAAGGLGYVIKVLMDTDLVSAINEALAGHTFTSRFPSEEDTP
jgi:DNA-binding NarL/FixJ family response regulator